MQRKPKWLCSPFCKVRDSKVLEAEIAVSTGSTDGLYIGVEVMPIEI